MIRRPPRSTRTDTLIPYNDALPIFLDLCAGDIGGSAARTWDIEAYAPGCDMWLEVSSVSWFTDYQARRANIRFRPSEGKGTEICHPVNRSAMGWPRTVEAYPEQHRQTPGPVGRKKLGEGGRRG